MTNIEITINDKALNERLASIIDKLEHPQAIHDVIAQVLYKHTMQTFADEGDPAGSWEPLKKSTLRDRRAKGYSPAPKLKRSERLIRSVVTATGEDYALIAIKAPYAPAMQFGAQIQRDGFVRLRTRNKQGELLRQKDHNNLAVFASNKHKKAVTRAVSYTINIPARPMLPVDENEKLKPSAREAIFKGVNQLLQKTS